MEGYEYIDPIPSAVRKFFKDGKRIVKSVVKDRYLVDTGVKADTKDFRRRENIFQVYEKQQGDKLVKIAEDAADSFSTSEFPYTAYKQYGNIYEKQPGH